jgi:hypothetical protein
MLTVNPIGMTWCGTTSRGRNVAMLFIVCLNNSILRNENKKNLFCFYIKVEMDQTKVIGIIAVVVVLVIILIFVYRDRKTLEKLTGPNVPGYVPFVPFSGKTNGVVYNPVLYKKLQNLSTELDNVSWNGFLQGLVQLKDFRNELSNYLNTAISLVNETKKFVALKPEYAQGLEHSNFSSTNTTFLAR